jgi:hypothetical protein
MLDINARLQKAVYAMGEEQEPEQLEEDLVGVLIRRIRRRWVKMNSDIKTPGEIF